MVTLKCKLHQQITQHKSILKFTAIEKDKKNTLYFKNQNKVPKNNHNIFLKSKNEFPEININVKKYIMIAYYF